VNQPDAQARAEAKALLHCIEVTREPGEQNRLWNRYYRLSDSVFPEAAALHRRYKSLQGAERQRFKMEYMDFVRRLWAATDPEAAYGGSFIPEVPPAAPHAAPAPTDGRPRPARRSPWARALVLAATVALLASAAYWQLRTLPPELEGAKLPAESPVPQVGPDDPAASAGPTSLPPEPPAVAEPVEAYGEEPPPLAAIEAELAVSIRPVFKPLPESLRGAGDRVVAGGKTYDDVYVVESPSQYYVRLPAEGAVAAVPKADGEVSFGADPDRRAALLELWKENRAEIERVAAEREKAKQVRLAAHFRAQEAAREARAAAQEAERWRVKGADWLALTGQQRNAARARAYSDWQAVKADVASVEELYYRITRGYEIIGITDSRAGRLTSAYRAWERDLGPNFEVENALIGYQWTREEIVKELAGWEREYYRLLEHVGEVYPACEARVEEIRRLDETLPAALYAAEGTIDWDRAPKADGGAGGGGGVGTGFIVAEGHIMTAAHVVRRGGTIRATSTAGTEHAATVVTMDTANDWALLRVEGLAGAPIPVAEGKPNVGATIYCLGYPLGGIKDSADPIVGSGNIAALQRLDGDQRFMQITAPVNPGNSGGPVLDQFGRWVGIVSQKLNDQHTLDTAQTVAQGVNFAVKATFIQPMLDPRAGVTLTPFLGDATTPLSLESIVQSLAPSIVRINVR